MASKTRLLFLVTSLVAQYAGAQAITEFALPTIGSSPFQIATGPDGNLWFTENNLLTPKIGRITPTGVITELPMTGSAFPASDITAGPDGNLWITIADTGEGSFAAIGRFTPAGALTIYALPNPASNPGSITTGADGALWFTERIGNRIGRITTAGAITEFPLPIAQSGPTSITSGVDGNLWFTESGTSKIGRITPAGVITEFSIPSSGQPLDIASGPDGNIWFTELSQIGRITTAGVITEFPGQPGYASRISPGPDGNVWFTEFSRISRITPAGTITHFPIPSSPGDAQGITAGPDDAIWFTEVADNKIGRITTGIVADPMQILPVVGSTVGVGESFFRTSVQLHNAGTTPSVGGIVFHPSGRAGSVQDPALTFTLAPGETRTIPDLLPAMGLSGLGSADVILTLGSAGNVPVVAARVFNDAGAAGTTGFALNALTTDDALHAGRRGVLFVPSDLTAFRFNIGVRTLNEPVLMTLTVRDAAGAIVATVPRFFPAVYHE
jgi:streptogramin lyase